MKYRINDDGRLLVEVEMTDAGDRGWITATSLNAGRIVQALETKLANVRTVEADIREQASGAQDGELLHYANRLRTAMK